GRDDQRKHVMGRRIELAKIPALATLIDLGRKADEIATKPQGAHEPSGRGAEKDDRSRRRQDVVLRERNDRADQACETQADDDGDENSATSHNNNPLPDPNLKFEIANSRFQISHQSNGTFAMSRVAISSPGLIFSALA